MKVKAVVSKVTSQDNNYLDYWSEAFKERSVFLSQLRSKQPKLNETINKCNALEEKFKELAKREESWVRRQKKTR